MATWAMSAAHMAVIKSAGRGMDRAPSHNGEDATVQTAQIIVLWLTGSELQSWHRRAAGTIIHYAFGTSMAVAYGIAAERAPWLSVAGGVPFGCAIWLGAHIIAVPALGLAKPVSKSSLAMELAEVFDHVIYGAVCEAVRCKGRSWLN